MLKKIYKSNSSVITILLLAGFFLVLMLIMQGCRHSPLGTDDIGDILPDPSDTSGGSGNNGIPCNPDTIYFNNTILPLFISNCAKSGCHDAASAQDDIILNSYANIMNSGEIEPFDAGEGDIMEAITENDPDKIMPPPPNQELTPQQVAQIAQWINQGAQNNSCESCDTLNVTFSGKIKPILDGKCAGCHSGAAPSGGINLTAYSGVQAVALDGRLFGAVNHSAGYTAMPMGGNKLPQCEIDAIRIWVDAGALNN